MPAPAQSDVVRRHPLRNGQEPDLAPARIRTMPSCRKLGSQTCARMNGAAATRDRARPYSSRIRILLAAVLRIEIASTAICFWVSIAFCRIEASSMSVSTSAPTLLSIESDRLAV
ncbi:hypothetical protein ACQY74_005308 [Rhizobium leguminosarum bv. trifolii]